MHWTRVKTIFIIVFAVLDMFLLAASAVIFGANKIDKDTINYTVKVLESNNIHISKEIIDPKILSLSVVETENLRADRDAFARLLLKDENAAFKDGAYKSGDKRIVFDGASFLGTNLIEDISPFTPSHISGELEKIGLSLSDVSSDGQSMTFKQKLDKQNIFEAKVTVNSDNTVYGYAIVQTKKSSFSKKDSSRLMPVCSVLVNLINEPSAIGETVSSVETGLTLGNDGGNDTHTLVSAFPAYRINTQSGKYFVFDASSGELIYKNN